VVLGNWDSTHFYVVADVPGASIAGVTSVVNCVAVSQTNNLVTSSGSVSVAAGAYFEVALTPLNDDTVASPSQIIINAIVTNYGNDYDNVGVTVVNDLGWTVQQTSPGPNILPFGMDTVTFSVSVPAEVAHLTQNNIHVRATSFGGNGDTISFQVTVDNQFLPPQLVSPPTPYYTQDRSGTFSWDGEGDSFNLIIANNQQLTNIVRSYTGISELSYAMPAADSLPDGVYYWAVKQYFGPDSSSYQANPRQYAVDNVPPQTMAPVSPVNGAYVGQKTFSFVFTAGKAAEEAMAGITPEYVRLQVARDSDFSIELYTFEPISGATYVIADTLDEGRWYWRVEQADSAGNNSGFGAIATFVLDSETPPIPTLMNPIDASVVDTDSITFRWSATPPPAWENSGEYYRIQASTSPQFLSIIRNQLVYVDSLKLASSLFPQNEVVYWRVRTSDSAGHTSDYQASPFSFTYSLFLCGDINTDSNGPNILDLNYLVNYIFRLGSAPNPFVAGSVNCDVNVNILDLNYMVNFIFRLGPAPCCL
jgi:hypothetical protein